MRQPSQGDGHGGPLVLETRGRGYVELYDSDFGHSGGCRHMCDLTIHSGRTLTLTPRPNSCFEFVRWTGACAGRSVCTLSSGGETTAIFTTEPSGGEWSAPPASPPENPPLPFEVPGYSITEITHSPHGLFVPRALDENGDVLGGVVNCGTRPARYDAGTGSYSILTPLPDDDAAAISAASDGTILVRDLNLLRGYRWKDGVLAGLGPLGSHRMDVTAMNAAGWAVGYLYLGTYSGTPHAFVHDGTEMKDLGEGWAHAVNAAGEVVGITGQNAALFGPPTTLLAISSRAVAYDVSDTGIVVGSAGQGLEQKWPPTAFVYDLRSGALTTISPLPGDLAVQLEHVNPSGTLAVGRSWSHAGTRPVLWTEGDLHELSTYLAITGAPTDLAVLDVNDRGQFLVAQDWVRYFILTPG